MTRRSGFTLLELIVSLAIAGVIALLVYGSASAGFDTRDVLDRHRDGAEAELRVRTLIADALRHASDEVDAGESAFDLRDATDSQGIPADRLTFMTRGVAPPLGASGRWSVTLEVGNTGFLMRAMPIAEPTGAERPGSISAILRDVHSIDVEVMAQSQQGWSTTWPSSGQLPAAVRITFLDASGSRLGAQIVSRLGLEAIR